MCKCGCSCRRRRCPEPFSSPSIFFSIDCWNLLSFSSISICLYLLSSIMVCSFKDDVEFTIKLLAPTIFNPFILPQRVGYLLKNHVFISNNLYVTRFPLWCIHYMLFVKRRTKRNSYVPTSWLCACAWAHPFRSMSACHQNLSSLAMN